MNTPQEWSASPSQVVLVPTLCEFLHSSELSTVILFTKMEEKKSRKSKQEYFSAALVYSANVLRDLEKLLQQRTSQGKASCFWQQQDRSAARQHLT